MGPYPSSIPLEGPLWARLPSALVYQLVATVVMITVYGLIASWMSEPADYLLDHFRFRPAGSTPLTDDVITLGDTLTHTAGLFKLVYVWFWLKGWARFARERQLLRGEHPWLYRLTRVLIMLNAVPVCGYLGVNIGVGIARAWV